MHLFQKWPKLTSKVVKKKLSSPCILLLKDGLQIQIYFKFITNDNNDFNT